MRWTRRRFGVAAGAASLTLGSRRTRGQARPRVVVVGGGVGGATVAKYLVASAGPVEVTLVEPRERYTTCFGSNLYLAGLRSLASLGHGYERLSERYGIKVVRELATMIDPAAKTVRLESGARLGYDRLVVSPGVAFRFDAIDGYDEAATQIMPHAWSGGPQLALLRAQLEAMADGGVLVIAVPKSPIRCPPGPYERASLAAHYFKRSKPRSKILIIDEKDSFYQQDLFEEAWNRHYPGMIDWLPGQFTGGIKSVDVRGRLVETASETFEAGVANIVPPQAAGELAQRAGLADQSGWCPVDATTFESKLHPDIHVIGDSADAGDMPKSAFCANSQAKACAFGIAAALAGSPPPAPHLFNTCFTYLAPDDAVSNAISFVRAGARIKVRDVFGSTTNEDAATRGRVVREADGWYDAFTHDVFG